MGVVGVVVVDDGGIKMVVGFEIIVNVDGMMVVGFEEGGSRGRGGKA